MYLCCVYFCTCHIKITFESTLQGCGVVSSSDGQTKEVVVVGGYDGYDFLTTVEIFKLDTKKWRSAGRIIKTVNFNITEK
jgi:hypothetical protein